MPTSSSSSLLNVAPSSLPGMGSMLYPGGAAFRVWAPFAAKVFVAGTFNAWKPRANPLASEGDGYWSADVPGVQVGHQYKLVIDHGDQTLWRINPYAREVVNSVFLYYCTKAGLDLAIVNRSMERTGHLRNARGHIQRLAGRRPGHV